MRSMVRGASAAFLALFAIACSAQDAATFTEGKEYKKVREVQAPADPKRIEVAEFFWYGCPHCYAFDPTIEAWSKKRAGDVDFVRVPSTLGRKEGVMHAKAFYAAEALTQQTGLAVEVAVIDRLPVPFGLVRYGVAPDHHAIRSIRHRWVSPPNRCATASKCPTRKAPWNSPVPLCRSGRSRPVSLAACDTR